MKYEELQKKLQNTSSGEWDRQGQALALDVFHQAAMRVPAYKDFLARHRINPASIKTTEDFRMLPLIDKNNYIRAYPVEALALDGTLAGMTMFSVSSGSSGKPFFWPRGDGLEQETAALHTVILKDFFGADKTPTLVIDTFSMGVYIAGVITLNAVLRTAERGYPISLITPGTNVGDVLRIVNELGHAYGQIILAGYPPFVKDIIDTGLAEGVQWKRLSVKFLFATENISEAYRDHLLEKVGGETEEGRSFNIYGSAEAGILGHETPASIAIRRMTLHRTDLGQALWGNAPLTPTFVQYHPAYKYFEEVNEEIILTTFGGIPLVRYNFHDNGRVVPYQQVANMLGDDMPHDAWETPFLAVFGKSDQTILFYGLQIYPEHIREGLEHKDIAAFVTGKLTMRSYEDKNQDKHWQIYVELREGVKMTPAIRGTIKEHIHGALLQRNMEYGRLCEFLGNKAYPDVILCEKGDPKYFGNTSVKQRWIT